MNSTSPDFPQAICALPALTIKIRDLVLKQLLSPFSSVILCFTCEILTGCIIYTVEGIYPGQAQLEA